MQPTSPSPQELHQPRPAAPQPEPPGDNKLGFWGFLGGLLNNWFVSWFVIPIAMVLILHFYVFSAYHVVGTSMTPSLQNSDYLIISKVEHTGALLAHDNYIPSREQIVVFHYPKQPSLDFVKRVIGLPGERVVVENCKVTVYNKEHPDGFDPDTAHNISGTCTEGELDEVIPDGNVFVLGDNRLPGGSSDSREWGLLPSNDIVGNVVLRLLPINSIRLF